jgi:hypothetical protein
VIFLLLSALPHAGQERRNPYSKVFWETSSEACVKSQHGASLETLVTTIQWWSRAIRSEALRVHPLLWIRGFLVVESAFGLFPQIHSHSQRKKKEAKKKESYYYS